MAAEPQAVPADDWCSYASWGERFFALAITEGRILAGVDGLAGRPISFGPIGVGPGRLARVTANGQVGRASIARRDASELIAFDLDVPVALDLLIDLGVDQHRFSGDLNIHLALTARAAEPLRVVIDVDPPTKSDISVDLNAQGVRASVLQRAAGMDQEIRRFVAKYVDRELTKPHIRAARDIDVAAYIERAYRSD